MNFVHRVPPFSEKMHASGLSLWPVNDRNVSDRGQVAPLTLRPFSEPAGELGSCNLFTRSTYNRLFVSVECLTLGSKSSRWVRKHIIRSMPNNLTV